MLGDDVHASMKCPYCKHELNDADLKRICKNADAQKFGSAGGSQRAKKLSAKRRREIAIKAAAARWGKTEELK